MNLLATRVPCALHVKHFNPFLAHCAGSRDLTACSLAALLLVSGHKCVTACHTCVASGHMRPKARISCPPRAKCIPYGQLPPLPSPVRERPRSYCVLTCCSSPLIDFTHADLHGVDVTEPAAARSQHTEWLDYPSLTRRRALHARSKAPSGLPPCLHREGPRV